MSPQQVGDIARLAAGPLGGIVLLVCITLGLSWVARKLFTLWQAAMIARLQDRDAALVASQALNDKLTEHFHEAVKVMEGQRELLEKLAERREDFDTRRRAAGRGRGNDA